MTIHWLLDAEGAACTCNDRFVKYDENIVCERLVCRWPMSVSRHQWFPKCCAMEFWFAISPIMICRHLVGHYDAGMVPNVVLLFEYIKTIKFPN